MKLAEVDWGYLRMPLVCLIVAALVGGTLLWMSFDFASEQKDAFTRARSKLMTNRNRYQTLDEEERIIVEYLPRFRRLEAAGLVGAEPRLDWIESLRQSGEQAGVLDLRYTLDAREPFPLGPYLDDGLVRIYSSRMRLELELLHEGDLLLLFENLEASAPGLFTVSDCRIDRQRPVIDLSAQNANLSASCTLDWLTVGPLEQRVQGPGPEARA